MNMNRSRSIVQAVVMGLLAIVTVITTLAATPALAEKKGGSGITPLSEEEVEMLTYMREEEKLARDVYLLMYETWEAAIFTKIADSEQKHMDTMLKKLDKYGLPDPALDDGEFTMMICRTNMTSSSRTGSSRMLTGCMSAPLSRRSTWSTSSTPSMSPTISM